MALTKQDLQAIAQVVDERLDVKLEEKLEEKLKPIRKDIAKLQKTLDMTIRNFDKEIMYNRKSIRRLEDHDGLNSLPR